jgi:hypothetical protein
MLSLLRFNDGNAIITNCYVKKTKSHNFTHMIKFLHKVFYLIDYIQHVVIKYAAPFESIL